MSKSDPIKESASQTAGPYVHIGLAPEAAGFDIYQQELGRDIIDPNIEGNLIAITGRVVDGKGAPVTDVLIEVWQADANGIYQQEAQNRFRGWGRVIPDFETGMFTFRTIKPGSVRDRNGRQMAPQLNLWLVSRGINIGLNTRMYFGDEVETNELDPVLSSVQPGRRKTLIARPDGSNYHFEIHLQGRDETVFFDV